MQTDKPTSEITRLEREAIDAMSRGQGQRAIDAWHRITLLEPGHAQALTQLGQVDFQRGDFEAAQERFRRAAEAQPDDPRRWVNLAFASQRLDDEAGEDEAIRRALAADPQDLMALILRGRLRERQGRAHDAAQAYGAAATVSPPLDRLTPELRPAVQHALQYREGHRRALAEFLDRWMEPHLKADGGGHADRFRLSLDILVGRKRRFDSMPSHFFVPGLEPVEFFERRDFPWLEEVESGTEAIRAEFLAALAADQGFTPYIDYADDLPVAQWAELNRSLRWSVLHLVKDGQRVESNASRCPQTMACWERVPSPVQQGRSPVALFSLLKPRTRIPPHNGASNARLLTHLPLIVPPGCGFRVGNSVREWQPGVAWVFDDTIEHEAWNGSDQLRAIMIFDVWHPRLDENERRLISALNEAINAFGDEALRYEV